MSNFLPSLAGGHLSLDNGLSQAGSKVKTSLSRPLSKTAEIAMYRFKTQDPLQAHQPVHLKQAPIPKKKNGI